MRLDLNKVATTIEKTLQEINLTHKDTILDEIPIQTKYSKPIPTPIINTNKQYYNKAIQNNKCTTDHLNILQCNIQGVGRTFERIDKLITTQIASAYDPDILLISETLADNSKLLKLHRHNCILNCTRWLHYNWRLPFRYTNRQGLSMAASTPISVYDRELNATDKLAAYCCTIAVEHPNAITLLMLHQYTYQLILQKYAWIH